MDHELETMLLALAKELELDRSAILRRLIKLAYNELANKPTN